MADCYVFPTISGNSIFTPLSVLEAMSCNLPVISTRFDGLLKCFIGVGGLLIVDSEKGFLDSIRSIKNDPINIDTRENIIPYSWEDIVKKLETIYIKIYR
jgi:glycosyltransferase involved in cell wall biosynthesis